jgi:hypothetical protein
METPLEEISRLTQLLSEEEMETLLTLLQPQEELIQLMKQGRQLEIPLTFRW